MNGGSTGTNFLERYFVIGLVVSLRWATVVGFIFLVSGVIIELIFPSRLDETSWQIAVAALLAEMTLYWRIGKHIGDVAYTTEA
jgi:hypothetical protein